MNDKFKQLDVLLKNDFASSDRRVQDCETSVLARIDEFQKVLPSKLIHDSDTAAVDLRLAAHETILAAIDAKLLKLDDTSAMLLSQMPNMLPKQSTQSPNVVKIKISALPTRSVRRKGCKSSHLAARMPQRSAKHDRTLQTATIEATSKRPIVASQRLTLSELTDCFWKCVDGAKHVASSLTELAGDGVTNVRDYVEIPMAVNESKKASDHLLQQ